MGSGGWPHSAFDHYLRFKVGVCSESSYPYTGRDGSKESCPTKKNTSCSVAIAKDVVTGHTDVAKSSAGLKSALSAQPVSVTVNAGQLQFYGNGVVTGTCSGQINHAVVAVVTARMARTISTSAIRGELAGVRVVTFAWVRMVDRRAQHACTSMRQ